MLQYSIIIPRDVYHLFEMNEIDIENLVETTLSRERIPKENSHNYIIVTENTTFPRLFIDVDEPVGNNI